MASALAAGGTAGYGVTQGSTGRDRQSPRFAQAKFRPTTLPATLVTRPALLGRLDEGASKRLTVMNTAFVIDTFLPRRSVRPDPVRRI
jgi:hypothetical protein